MYEAADLRKGLKIQIEGEPYIITDFSFVKPGKGQALYKCRLKNLITGTQFDRNYRSGDRFEPADLDEQEMEFLYLEGNQYCFMNSARITKQIAAAAAKSPTSQTTPPESTSWPGCWANRKRLDIFGPFRFEDRFDFHRI